ncbi:MAG: hypothetical protein EHM25_01025 [Nitrosopumilales archaeon]|nr:MAG: hypothetical protein EHM25_12665 [Nitrosopumilales archaeon]RPJ31556.1 MAG: hypothetical protein EHM25_02665 [Nitrosopumilales archaeon]RPJ32333.1 MAG: hypothetical protein EHM25_01025 [Nitrosopumilales archaeon]
MKIEIEVEYKINCTGYVRLDMSENEFLGLNKDQQNELLKHNLDVRTGTKKFKLDDPSKLEWLKLEEFEIEV